MDDKRTITAICGGTGGAIGILRLSGEASKEILFKLWRPSKKGLASLPPRAMTLGRTLDGAPGEPSLAVLMPGPGSYTGEDVVEIHCHGGPIAARRLLDAAIRAGARHAEPGEFTRRAFINGKLDLTQAEAVSDLIGAQSKMAFELAERQLSGSLGKALKPLRASLLDLLAELESRLDFPEEDLDWKPKKELLNSIASATNSMRRLLDSRKDGAIIRDGIRLAIAGRPNVGKSSLLNALLGYDRAIVAPSPGTTRDTVEEHATLRGIEVRLADTAGLRDASDLVERLGIERSKASMRQAGLILWVLDASSRSKDEELAEMKAQLPQGAAAIAVWNKTDLLAHEAALPETGLPTAKLSATTGQGIENLLDLFERSIWGSSTHHEPESAVNSRHSALLEEAIPALEDAAKEIPEESWELAASGVRAAISAIGRISGEDASPDILDEIFSRFCIGK